MNELLIHISDVDCSEREFIQHTLDFANERRAFELIATGKSRAGLRILNRSAKTNPVLRLLLEHFGLLDRSGVTHPIDETESLRDLCAQWLQTCMMLHIVVNKNERDRAARKAEKESNK